MTLDAVIKKIDRHIKKDFVQPLIVDVQNSDDRRKCVSLGVSVLR